ncbi:MAG: penicillin-binding protein 2 [Deltaproteobacteria bacterium]|nr:penicillin-binding protein 2 [Deltaproteobacteria bacterium]
MRKKASKDYFPVKAYLVMALFAVGYALVVYRLYALQIRDHRKLRERAEKQQMRIVKIMPKRGTIYDREMRELAISVDTVSLYAVPSQVGNKPAAARILARMTGKRRRRILKSLMKKKQFVWIARKCNPSILKRLGQAGLNGIHALYESKRFYPNRTMAAGVLGIVGMDNEGLEGIEYKYDALLKGKPGYFLASVDAKRRKIMDEGEGFIKPAGANHLVLTLDRVIQHIAEEELKNAVEENQALSGTAVMIRPQTGEILAMASYPGFDPNKFCEASARDRRNLAIQENFEPGSTFKLVTLAAALDRGVIHPKDIFYCENGAYRFRTTIYHDTHEYGWLTVRQILQRSSNIGAIKIGEHLDEKDFYRYITDFGFGKKTGIDLPGEANGMVRPTKEWSGLSEASLSMGQELSVTALQVVSAVATIANEGVRMQPYVVSRVIDEDRNVVRKFPPQVRRRVISRQTADFLIRCMEAVVSEGGTAPKAGVPGFRVAGKTGTAQKFDPELGRYSRKDYIGSFVGFVPVDRPEFALIVVVNEPHGRYYYGGLVAAPAFRRIAERTLRYLRVVPPQSPEWVLTRCNNRKATLAQVNGSG